MQLRSQLRQPVSPHLRGLFGRSVAPDGAILHWDADMDAFAEQTDGVHTFNHAVLSPQYQRTADGSYSNVGAKPAVDTFDGKRWLRSCGAVTNMLTNSVFAGAVSGTPGTAPTGWAQSVSGGTLTANANGSLTFMVAAARHNARQAISVSANTVYSYCANIISDGVLELGQVFILSLLPSGATTQYYLDGAAASAATTPTAGSHTVCIVLSVGATAGTIYPQVGAGLSNNATGTVTISNPQLTATAYPQPYVPTTTAGPVTQPASNATTTNGCWFSLPDGSPLWQALTGQPLTLATRVRMGVGSGNFPVVGYPVKMSVNTYGSGLIYNALKSDGTSQVGRTSDNTTWLNLLPTIVVNRGDVWDLVVQVSSDGLQYRSGRRKVGNETAITWGPWTGFDGSFNPSTLYRLMLNYGDAYPAWFNKITAWKKQATDAEILEAMAA